MVAAERAAASGPVPRAERSTVSKVASEVLGVPCPVCLAAAGEWCAKMDGAGRSTRSGGSFRPRMHPARFDLAGVAHVDVPPPWERIPQSRLAAETQRAQDMNAEIAQELAAVKQIRAELAAELAVAKRLAEPSKSPKGG